MEIKNLFDPGKDIYRSIEKVITYDAVQENRLKAEISEYVVTENIEEQFEKLLSRMQTAMEAGGASEIGVWVSGFYGSGKSSFTKYLGFAFDDRITVDGIPFLKHLQDRLHRPTSKALLSTLVQRYPAAVVMVDLATDQLAGATMVEVSSVLYYKVLQWAGYSHNLKIAAFERKLKKDGRYQEFLDLFKAHMDGAQWDDFKNDPLIVDSLIPTIAHEMYPSLFKTDTAFSSEASEVIRFEQDRVKEMLDIAREASGKDHIIFIIDEVGQYVGSRQNLILNLDGLSKNLKNIGDGKVWIIGTAQQTLTEDDPRAAFNSSELYKLKDRFPIQIDLESRDIREICYRRLLGKSPTGEKELGRCFDQHGQALRHNTRLQDARSYDVDFGKQTFIDLYPFLPAHFDILLHLLGALAKSTGGFGLRSAIKVIQDILVEGIGDRPPIAEQELGWLATTMTLYDALETDIRRAFPSLHQAVANKVEFHFRDSELHQDVAKTVAVLQILGNMPVTAQNVASLMHPGIGAASQADAVKQAIEDLINHEFVPFGEQEGNLRFFSEKLNNIEQERAKVPLRSIELRRITSEALREAYAPLPATQLQGSLTVTTGLKSQTGSGVAAALAGERNIVQTIVELADPANYDNVRNRLIEESRARTAQHDIFLLARHVAELEELCADIYRCREIASKYRNDPDKEVKDYCVAQADRVGRLQLELERKLRRILLQGSFVFRGQTTAVESLDQELIEAARKHLAGVTEQVFDRYGEAAVRAGTELAEKFLRAGNLTAITSQIDPLNLVQTQGGRPSIRTDHKAIVSIRDHIDRMGSIEGKRLSDYFTGAPFGWSPDTLRYLIAAMLVAGEIKLKVAGREVTVNGQQAIDALKTNNAFKNVGVALREERPSMDVLARAAERLTDLTGDMVVPLEDEISRISTRLFPRLQHKYAPLAEKLRGLDLPGAEQLSDLNQAIADSLQIDASDAPQRLGAEESTLYDSLKWAGQVRQSLEQGLEQTLRELQRHCREIQSLPSSDIPGQLKTELADELSSLGERLKQTDFFKHTADFNTALTTMQNRTRDAVIAMEKAQQTRAQEVEQDLQRLPEWLELTAEEQGSVFADLENLALSVSHDLDGLKRLINQKFEIQSLVSDLKQRIASIGEQRQRQRLEEEKAKAEQAGRTKLSRALTVPTRITGVQQLETLIRDLQALQNELALYSEIEISIELKD